MTTSGMGFYNGWSPEERRATLPLLREALRTGQLAPARRCSICGFVNADDGSGQNYCTFHDERYDVLEPYPICRTCHRTLHRRFERPRPWLSLIAAHGNRGAWFERLTLDPQSQLRPFSETYPDGVPAR